MRDIFAAVPALAELPEHDRRRFEGRAVRLSVRRGTLLVRQGDSADELYIVLAGRFLVTLDGRTGAIAEIGPGEPIGELAFFGGGRRTANVIAARDSEVLALTREAYVEVTQRAPEIQTRLLTTIATRLAALTPAAPTLGVRPARSIAILPAGATGDLPPGFAQRIAAALAPHNVAVLSNETIRAELGSGSGGIAGLVANIERSADIVLFMLGRDQNGPAHLCLNFADGLLLVASPDDRQEPDMRPSPTEREARKLFAKEHVSLVICREHAASPIAPASGWLANRDVALHHHLALDRPADFERLGRFIAGTAKGLVLGGGGVFGCAHIGVAKALKECGMPIDFVGGTSVGAGVATALAAGFDPDDILEGAEEMFLRNRAMRRLTVPIHSILDHRAFDAALQRHYGSRRLEDMPLNCFTVSANLTNRRMFVHRSGPLWEAVRASTAIPGVLPPFITAEGDVLVDGALVDNVPVDVMRKLKLGPNVVVLFRHSGEWRFTRSYADLPSRAALLRQVVFRRRAIDYPTLVSIVMRGMFLTSESIERMVAPGDLFVSPTFPPEIRLLDWRRGREIAAGAYLQMRDILAREGPVPEGTREP